MQLTSPCSDLGAFVDGELETSAADRFNDHLDTCTACREALADQMQIEARLSVIAERRTPQVAINTELHTALVVYGSTVVAVTAALLGAPAISCVLAPMIGFQVLSFLRTIRARRRQGARSAISTTHD
jgi:anti-sigma factor RsiW